jgi:hypothetical protein
MNTGVIKVIPKPIMEMLGRSKTIKFIIKKEKVELEAGNK